jgi:hypothetical protein
LNLNELQALTPQALEDLCRTFDVRMHPGRTRHHHIVDLVRVACGQGVPVRVEGFFDIVADNFGLLRFPALNFLPVPGLDGYGIIEPWLSYNVKRQVEPFAPFGLLFVFVLLWVPSVNREFFDMIDAMLRGQGISDLDSYCGQSLYRFWEGSDGFCSVSR